MTSTTRSPRKGKRTSALRQIAQTKKAKQEKEEKKDAAPSDADSEEDVDMDEDLEILDLTAGDGGMITYLLTMSVVRDSDQRAVVLTQQETSARKMYVNQGLRVSSILDVMEMYWFDNFLDISTYPWMSRLCVMDQRTAKEGNLFPGVFHPVYQTGGTWSQTFIPLLVTDGPQKKRKVKNKKVFMVKSRRQSSAWAGPARAHVGPAHQFF